MFFLFIILILLPTILDYTDEKKIGLRLSFFFLFFLAAFQYVCSNDFWGYYGYWNRVLSGDYRDLEPLYCSLIEFFEPIGYFGWLIICAAFNIGIYYRLVKKYVKPQYYWITILTFTLWTRFFLLMTNCNRQTLAATFIVLMFEIICSSYKNSLSNDDKEYRICGFKIESLFLSIACYFIAVNIHTTAVVGILIYPIIFLSSRDDIWNNRCYVVISFVLIFLLRNFVNISFVANYVKEYFLDHHSHFAYMADQIGGNSSNSIYLDLLYLSYIILLGFIFKQLTLFEKVMGLSFVVAVFIQPLFSQDMERMMMYFQILFPILAAIMVSKLSFEHYLLKSYFIILVALYGINNIMTASHHPLYHNWFDNFDLIFSHPWR